MSKPLALKARFTFDATSIIILCRPQQEFCGGGEFLQKATKETKVATIFDSENFVIFVCFESGLLGKRGAHFYERYVWD